MFYGANEQVKAKIYSRSEWYLDALMKVSSHGDTNQQIAYLICIGQYLSQRRYTKSVRKRLEEELRQSQARVQSFMNSPIMGTFLAIEGGDIVEANDTFLHMTGYSRQDLGQHRLNLFLLTPPAYAELTEQAYTSVRLHEFLPACEKEYICKDGSYLPILLGAVVTQLTPLHIHCFVLDNTARKQAEQRKDDFLSIASHELSAPLTAVKLQTQLAQRRLQKRGELQLADDLTKLQEPIGQLERLVRELFDVSKMQASRLEYLREPVEMNALLYKVADMMHQQNPTYTILVQSTQPLTLMGDTKRLEQVFINLLSNAIKYSPEKKRVELTMSASGKTVTISVRDYGLGISQEYQKHIFERFYRIDHQKLGSIGGLGIGLYIVAEIVKQHGGTITVESCRGEGSTFQVILPLEIP